MSDGKSDDSDEKPTEPSKPTWGEVAASGMTWDEWAATGATWDGEPRETWDGKPVTESAEKED